MQKIVSAVTLIKWTLWNWPHTRTDCSQVVKIATLSEGFRQDVREVTSSDKFSNNRVQDNDHSYMLFIFVRTRGKLASYAAIDA